MFGESRIRRKIGTASPIPALHPLAPKGRRRRVRMSDRNFLIGVSLYTQGNVWGIADPPEDWNCISNPSAASAGAEGNTAKSKNVWPYNLFSGQGEAHPGRK